MYIRSLDVRGRIPGERILPPLGFSPGLICSSDRGSDSRRLLAEAKKKKKKVKHEMSVRRAEQGGFKGCAAPRTPLGRKKGDDPQQTACTPSNPLSLKEEKKKK